MPTLSPLVKKVMPSVVNIVAEIPAEDGGYVLIGTRAPYPQLFAGIAWSTPRVLAETRTRVITQRLRLAELPPL